MGQQEGVGQARSLDTWVPCQLWEENEAGVQLERGWHGSQGTWVLYQVGEGSGGKGGWEPGYLGSLRAEVSKIKPLGLILAAPYYVFSNSAPNGPRGSCILAQARC